MAVNRQHKVSVEGIFDKDKMTVLHETKDGFDLYDFDEILNEFDGRNIAINITEKLDLPKKHDIEDEDDDE